MRRYHASFSYQAGTWDKPRRVVAKVEWHPGELYPRVGFIVTNLGRCQSASKIDPLSTCNIDPLSGTAEVVSVVNRGDPSGFV